MSSSDTTSYYDDDEEKLVPEWGQSGDNQIIWLGLLIAGLLGFLWFGATMCGSSADDIAAAVGVSGSAEADTVGAILDGDSDLSEAEKLIGRTSAEVDVADEGPYTVFAPVNAAFDGDIEDLNDLADYHVVKGTYKKSDLVAGTVLTTIGGETLRVGGDGSLNQLGKIVDADQRADNGILHTVDGVLGPMPAQPTATAVPPEPTAVPEPTPVPPEPTAVPAPAPTEVPATATAVPEPTAAPEPTAVPPTPVPAPADLVASLNELFALEPIQFNTSSAEIREESQSTLDQAIEILSGASADAKVQVQGHTDSRGAADSNQALSEARANSVLDYLVAGGVDAGILSAQGYGETNLKVDPEETDADLEANRRIEFAVLEE